jgi:hypothetical protein
MPSLLDKIGKELREMGVQPRTQQVRSWLMGKISGLKMPTNRSNILNDPTRVSPQAFIGRMYFFAYDAKLKDVLPMWDKFPLVIPIETYSDGFLGMNLHYLDPMSRLFLLDRLMDFLNNDKYDNTTKFNLSYDLLSQSRRYQLFKPCIKRYLLNHITSSIIYVEPDQWETACFLPVAKFVYRT